MRILLDQFVMHAGNIVERHPSPEHRPHDTFNGSEQFAQLLLFSCLKN